MTSCRAALYLRVSTRDQTTETQEAELRRWAERLGLEVVRVYADTASGARSDRAALAAVLAGAHRREFDVLLIWALDRISREGIGPTLGYLNRLTAAGVRVLSHQEAWLDSSTPMWDLFVSISAFWAKQERQRIGERVRAGQARAKGPGRPVRAEAPAGGPRGAPPSAGGRVGVEKDRAGHEGPYVYPSPQVSGLPKVPRRVEAWGSLLGGRFRGARGEDCNLKVSVQGPWPRPEHGAPDRSPSSPLRLRPY